MPADTLLTNEMMQALCRTFLHSLWQGMIAAALAGVVLLFTKRSTAALRYNLLLFIFTSFVLSTIATAFIEIDKTSGNQQAGTSTISYPAPVVFITKQESHTSEPVSLIQNIQNFCDSNASLILVAWSLLFLYKCSRLTLGLAQIRRLRRQQTRMASGYWKERLGQLKQQLGIQRAVELLESGLVNVPIAIGFFKPLVLLPIGFLSHLSPQQVETILIHELAHIRRKDYLVNLFQNVVETIFYFNPALVWISSLLRQEREACCDDVVMAYTSDSSSYVEALVAFQEYNMPHTLAIGIGNKKMHLLQRVKRLLVRENQDLCFTERIALLAGMVFFTVFTLTSFRPIIPLKEEASVNKIQSPSIYKEELRPHTGIYSDTPRVKAKSSNYQFKEFQIDNTDPLSIKISTTDQFGNKYLVQDKKGTKPTFYINGELKPFEELRRYDKLFITYKICKSVPASSAGKAGGARTKGNPALRAEPCLEAEPGKIGENNIDKKFELDIDNNIEFKDVKQWEFELKKSEFELKKKEIDLKKIEAAKMNMKIKYDLKMKMKTPPVKPRVFYKEKDTARNFFKPVQPAFRNKPRVFDARIPRVKEALVKYNVVARQSDIGSFLLTPKELVVNGQKMTSELHQKLLEQVNVNANGLYYGPGKKKDAHVD